MDPVTTLSADSKVPLYEQLHHLLRSAIISGALRPGQKLDSERCLAATYGVSRQTVRKALQQLVHEGLAYTRPGAGVFVANRNPGRGLQLLGFSEEMSQHGLVHTTRVLRAEIVSGNTAAATHLGLEEGEELFHLCRLRLLNNVLPVGISMSWLPCSCCPGFENYDFNNRSLYEVLEEQAHVQLAHGVQSISARLASPDESRLLEIEAPGALLVLERLTYDVHERRVEYMNAVYRPDRYSLRVPLKRTKPNVSASEREGKHS